ncbi:ATPase, T2SS/T4P/T4SS family [Cognatiyoonia sp. IB215182]|uniref:ATPase, T2SS/T4P/T4SS family n=1 Tax=Cognatiyoonia sp. IB215182 TaxID=3097353 RepID=UPI002A0C929A|nr:ATPase, T2SS/T4P/T4SS family [Cognatiyoonia sp. IB215182]MDX8355393.1 ATPase, T2SS/T4P/T4SS family [Cognatiyoonia sp. IB215182]
MKPTLQQLSPDAEFLDVIKEAIRTKKNILVSAHEDADRIGFIDACLMYLAEVEPDERSIILEDAAALDVTSSNMIQRTASGNKPMEVLLVAALHMGVKRIIVAEARTGEIMTVLLSAWNRSHPGGMTAIAANSVVDALARVQRLCVQEAPRGVDALIANALDLIVHLARGSNGPRVTELARVKCVNETFVLEEIYT